MQKIIPFLWFNDNAEEAVNFYLTIFKDSRITSRSVYGDAGPGPKGTLMVAGFQLEGQDFYAINGGPHFTFTPAISLYVNCETQSEIDLLWDKLSADGEQQNCGWLKDKYGISWQIVPSILEKMMIDSDAEKTNNVMKAILQMNKLDINVLKQAFEYQREYAK